MQRVGINLIVDIHLRASVEEFQAYNLNPNTTDKMGVMYTGPYGVRKSAHALACAITGFAHGWLTLYIPRADLWVAHAEDEEAARSYFMTEFCQQNADLIMSDPRILPFFEDLLCRDRPPTGKLYTAFAKLIAAERIPCNVIIDEGQKLLHAGNGEILYLVDGKAEVINKPKRFFLQVCCIDMHIFI